MTSFVFAADEKKLAVKSIQRISHPAYTMTNIAQTFNNPWNVDYSRIFLYELGIMADRTYEKIYHPDFPITYPNARSSGRKLMWGCLKSNCISESAGGLGDSINSTLQELDLENAYGNQSLIDWDNNTIPLPSQFDSNVLWSPYAGETNIMYALCEINSGVCSGHQYKLVAYNVDTGDLIPIKSYNVGGVDVSKASIIGFTKDVTTGNLGHKHEIIIDLDYISSKLYGDVVRIFTDRDNNFANAAYRDMNGGGDNREPAQLPCSSNMTWYPNPHGIHESNSPDGLYQFTSKGTAKVDGDNNQCIIASPFTVNAQEWWFESEEMDLTIDITHISTTTSSSDYYIGGNSTRYPWTDISNSQPYIGDERVYQVLFDRQYADTQKIGQRCPGCYTLNLLISRPSAAIWWPSGEPSLNYHTMPTPTISPDGMHLHFQGTNGKYTREDKSYCNKGKIPADCSYIGNNWEGTGTYIAELSYALNAQTCTSFTYSAWSECQPSNTKTRTVTSSSPAGCTGGSPILTQSCMYNTEANTVYKTTISPTVDGNLNEYALVNGVSLSPSTGGNTVTVKTLWNSEALYLGVTVTDSQLNADITTRDGSVWNEDSIEWFIDTYNDGGGSTTPNSSYMRTDDYHGIVNILNTKYDSQGTTSGTPVSSWNGAWQSAVKLNGTINNNSDSDTGYTIEIKIPWTSIGYSSYPTSDTLVGLSFALNDKDASGIASLMSPNITTAFENASKWQKVMLSGMLTTVDSIPPAPPVALMIE